MLGQAVHARVLRRGIQGQGAEGHAARRQAGIVGQVAHADGQVKIFFQQIHAARRQVQLQRNGRVAAQELGQHLAHQRVAEIGWHGNAQQAARTRLAVLGQRAGRFRFLDHLARMVEQAGAKFRQRQLARGAQQQPFAQFRFQQRDAARQGRLGQVHALGGARKTAALDDAREQQQISGIDIHIFDCCMSGLMLSILTPSASILELL